MPTIQDIDNQITALEAKQARPIREFSLNPMDIIAFNKIREIDQQVCDLRNQRYLLANLTAPDPVPVIAPEVSIDTCN